MAARSPINLKENLASGGRVIQAGPRAWRLEVPAGAGGRYRLAQLDDYHELARRSFAWRPPLRLNLRARASAGDLPGTWGFGLWNDPFGMAFLKGGGLRLPVLPNAAWYFFASPPNHLSLRDDLPAQGGLAATFRSPRWPGVLSLLGVPFLPLLLLPPVVKLFRNLGSRIVRQDAVSLSIDPTGWHEYSVEWTSAATTFRVDGRTVLETALSPEPPLGLVIWVDNQYAALPPDGKFHYGTLPNPEAAWIEVKELLVR